MSEEFDFNRALKVLQSGEPMTGKRDILTTLIKHLTEAPLEAEADRQRRDRSQDCVDVWSEVELPGYCQSGGELLRNQRVPSETTCDYRQPY